MPAQVCGNISLCCQRQSRVGWIGNATHGLSVSEHNPEAWGGCSGSVGSEWQRCRRQRCRRQAGREGSGFSQEQQLVPARISEPDPALARGKSEPEQWTKDSVIWRVRARIGLRVRHGAARFGVGGERRGRNMSQLRGHDAVRKGAQVSSGIPRMGSGKTRHPLASDIGTGPGIWEQSHWKCGPEGHS